MIASNYFPVMCGYSTRLQGIVSGLAKMGHSVTILVPNRGGNLPEQENPAQNIQVIRYPFHGYLSSLTLVSRVHNLLSGGEYDIVSGHSPVKCALAAYLGNLRTRLPFVFTIHYPTTSMEVSPKSINYWMWILFDEFIIKRADRLVVISEGITGELAKRKVPKDRMVLLPNAVDTKVFSPTPRDKTLESKYNLIGKKVVLFVGKFQEWEDLPKLVEVFSKVRERNKSVKLMLVGDGPERGNVEDSIARFSVKEDAIVTGFVPYEDVPKYYSLCDVFLMTRPKCTLNDLTTPIKPVEAMAMGKVIVSTDVGGMEEIITDGETGFLVEDSVNALAEKVDYVLSRPDIRRGIGENAREYVLREREWETIISRLAKEYETLTGR